VGAVDEAKARLREVVAGVERRSAAEIVVAVRPSAGSYLAIDLSVGCVIAYAVLLFTLYAPQVFDLHWIALMIPAAALLGVAFVRAVPQLRNAVARKAVDRAVRDRARVVFVELGLSGTRERTGILVFVAQVERRCVVLADFGARAAVPDDAWATIVARIEQSQRVPGPMAARMEALASAIEASADALAEHLPRRDHDANELEDVAW
jgi:putative membrane protein